MDSNGETAPEFGVFDERHVAIDGIGDGEIGQCYWRFGFSSREGHLAEV